MDKVIESFINQCDEMMIAEEGLFKSKEEKEILSLLKNNTRRRLDELIKEANEYDRSKNYDEEIKICNKIKELYKETKNQISMMQSKKPTLTTTDFDGVQVQGSINKLRAYKAIDIAIKVIDDGIEDLRNKK